MPFTPRQRLVNPRLGTYFGIFVSALAGLVLLLLIFEQLGASERVVRLAMLAGPVMLYAVLGLAEATREPLEFFAAGRRVPAFYGGRPRGDRDGRDRHRRARGALLHRRLRRAVHRDRRACRLRRHGRAARAVRSQVRRVHACATYLGRRFDSRAVRLAAAALLSVPILLALAAEIRMGAFAASALVGASASDAMLPSCWRSRARRCLAGCARRRGPALRRASPRFWRSSCRWRSSPCW